MLAYTLICVVVVAVFAADPTARTGAYATGVLARMTPGSIAVTIDSHPAHGPSGASFVFGPVALVFAYAPVANIVERPDGLTIALLFVGAIVAVSLVSRVQRSLELRRERIEIDRPPGASWTRRQKLRHPHRRSQAPPGQRPGGVRPQGAGATRGQPHPRRSADPLSVGWSRGRLRVHRRAGSARRRDRRSQGASGRELCGPECHRRAAAPEGHHGQEAPLLFRPDAREPHRVPDTLHPLRREGDTPPA